MNVKNTIMYGYNLDLTNELAEFTAFTMTSTLIKKEEKWMTTTEIINELKSRDIKTNRTYLLRKGKSGEFTMRTNPMNKKINLFNLLEVLEKLQNRRRLK